MYGIAGCGCFKNFIEAVVNGDFYLQSVAGEKNISSRIKVPNWDVWDSQSNTHKNVLNTVC